MPAWLRLFDPGPVAPTRVVWLRRFLALIVLGLVALTWRLWTPQAVYPQVPLIQWAIGAPRWLDWMGLAALALAALAALLAASRDRLVRPALALLAASMLGMFLLDQHRLQPWAWQFAITAIVLALANSRRSVALLRLLTVGLYFWSAISKLDSSFLHTLGQQFLAALLGTLVDDWSEQSRFWAAAAFPFGEMLVAVGLCIARLRRASVVLAIIMHLLLVWILSPWGLDHKPAVLVWNLYFVALNLLLFWPRDQRQTKAIATWRTTDRSSSEPAAGASTQPGRPPLRFGDCLVTALVVVATLVPTLELIGWWDHWPAWGLYSSRVEQIAVYVAQRQADELSPELQPLLEAASSDGWRRLRIDRWSLAALDVPIYPQNRFQLGVAAAVAEQSDLGWSIRVVELGPAGRFDRKRTSKELRGQDEIVRAADRHWLNAQPRASNADR